MPIYGGLNEISPPCSLGQLNAWFPVGCTVWGDLGGVTLLVEVCQRRQVLRLKSIVGPFLVCFLGFVFVVQDVNFQLPAPAAKSLLCHYGI